MDYTTQATLLARLAEGIDPTAWREFHDRYVDLIRSFARRRGLQPADCDDVAQDVLLALAKSLTGFEYDPVKGKFRSYLKTVTVREIIRKLRQNRGSVTLEVVETQASAEDPALESMWEEEWRKHHVRVAMRRLASEFNDRNRRAFTMYAMQGRSAAEAARTLGMSVDQVYQAKSRILRRLSGMIEEQLNDEE